MYCLPQRLKSTFFEIFWNRAALKGPAEWEKISKTIDFSLWSNRATTHSHISYCTILAFLGHNATSQWAKMLKKVHFGRTMYCFASKTKINIFRKKNSSWGSLNPGYPEWRKNSKNVDFSVWGNRFVQTTHTHIIFCTNFFRF